MEKLVWDNYVIEKYHFNTVIVGTGAAGYAAAEELLNQGVKDIAIVTESRKAGTSRNTGSDKQTYYKLTLSGKEKDSVYDMAESLFEGSCVDGDHALIEAALSSKQFFKLVSMGVPFPTNRYGEFIGYKTDHDPKQRATSVGPYTSKIMTEKIEQVVLQKNVPLYNNFQVVSILVKQEMVYGILCINKEEKDDILSAFAIFLCDNLIWATGGPACIYKNSVYPLSQHGATGVALEAGIMGKNLTEWQYGIASVRPRWNVSGTYMQAIPKFISTDENGKDGHEFLQEYIPDKSQLLSLIFLKGYEWPFDVGKLNGGSSIIDVAVYLEIVRKRRRVYLDYRENPLGNDFDFSLLSAEAYQYLEKQKAISGNPIDRLTQMNQPAVEFYRERGIYLKKDMLEISVSAQHNNGGLDVDLWWQTNIKGVFAIGEAAGTHGVYRPGGSALNAGQVGACRAAQYIANHQECKEIQDDELINLIKKDILLAENMLGKQNSIKKVVCDAQRTMSEIAANVRKVQDIKKYLNNLRELQKNFSDYLKVNDISILYQAFQAKDMLICQWIYLEAFMNYVNNGKTSRGSALYLNSQNDDVEKIFKESSYGKYEIEQKIQLVQKTESHVEFLWRRPREIPIETNSFEINWKNYREHGNND